MHLTENHVYCTQLCTILTLYSPLLVFQNHGTGSLFWLVSFRQATKMSKHYLISKLNTSAFLNQKQTVMY